MKFAVKCQELLSSIEAKENFILWFKKTLEQVCEQHKSRRKERIRNLDQVIRNGQKNIDQFLERICKTQNDLLVAKYEEKISVLQKDIDLAKENKDKDDNVDLESMLGTVSNFVENPLKFWSKLEISGKQRVHHLVFADKVYYEAKKGFRTPKTTCLFKLSKRFEGENSRMVYLTQKESNLILDEVKNIYNGINSLKEFNKLNVSTSKTLNKT